MSVFERWGKWRYRFKLRGRIYEGATGLSATKQNQNPAKAIEAQKRLEAEKGIYCAPVDGIPFNVAATEFLTWCHSTEYRQKPSTAKRISGSFVSMVEFFDKTPVHKIGPIDIERFKTYRIEVCYVQDCTVRNDLWNLSIFFKRYAIKAGWCDGNPVAEIRKPSAEGSERTKVLTAEEEDAYFAHAKGNLYDVAKIMILQGCRPEEVMGLRKTNYSRQRGQVLIAGGKTKAARRWITLCGESAAILDQRMGLPGEWLFPSDRIKGGHLQQLHTQHDVACRAAEVGFVLYDLRHTFATRFAQNGGDLATLAAILGHSSLRIVQKYVHPTAEHQKEAMRKYEASLPKKPLKKVKG